MEAKEKAFELYDKFRPLFSSNRHFKAKQSALIVVENIILEWSNESGRTAKQNYWEKVREEIYKIV